MNVLIIEDEVLTARHLENSLLKIDPLMKVIRICDSIKDSVAFLKERPAIDLIFSDIHLSDGLSFDIFTQIKIEIPVIFTTAYNEYAIKAFKVNSVDYLLKPIDREDLKNAINKFKKIRGQNNQSIDLNDIRSILKKEFKTRFMVRSGSSLISVKISDIAFFISEDGVVILTTVAGKRFAVDYTLDQLELQVNPDQFFRINRKILIHIDAIQKAEPHLNGRYKISNSYLPENENLVSRERVSDFKKWMDQ